MLALDRVTIGWELTIEVWDWEGSGGVGGGWDDCEVDCGWDGSVLEIIGAVGLIGVEGEDII